MSFTVVIPARYASSRLPGKPLLDIAGKTLIERVYDCAKNSAARDVIIATDDERIEKVAKQFSADVCMTSINHQTGSDRLTEVIKARKMKDDEIIVNLQGDEPLMPSEVINQVANNLAKYDLASATTVCERIEQADDLFDPHTVKVVTDQTGYAMYFSRASIPWDRQHFPDHGSLPDYVEHYRHIGLYAYRAGFLDQFVSWPVCHHEKVEALEQLRILWHGYKIHVEQAVAQTGFGVDTQEDLDKVRRIFESR